MFNIEFICFYGDVYFYLGLSCVSNCNYDSNVVYGNWYCKFDIFIFYVNLRSLVNKMVLLELEIVIYCYDIMVFMEIYLDSIIIDSELFFLNYMVFRRDCFYNGCKGGGVLIVMWDIVKVF